MLERLLSFLHTFCRHDGRTVIADIHSGDVGGFEVQWCLVCGALNHTGKAKDWELARSSWISWRCRRHPEPPTLEEQMAEAKR